MIQMFLSKIKGRPVVLDANVSAGYILFLVFEKIIALVRGIIITRRLVFVGKSSTVRGIRQFQAEGGSEIASFCYVDCLSRHGLFIGRGSKIGSYSVVKVSGSLSDLGQKIEIGRNVGIGEFAHIGGAGPVSIGDNTIAGPYLSIHPENHNFDKTEILIRLQGVTRKGVSIGADCWIGAKVAFLDGSSVGKGCVVAAGSVVTKAFPNNVVIGGVPAKILKHRELKK